MKTLFINIIGSFGFFHLLLGIYFLITEPNQKLFFILFFMGLIYTAIFLRLEKLNTK